MDSWSRKVAEILPIKLFVNSFMKFEWPYDNMITLQKYYENALFVWKDSIKVKLVEFAIEL